MRISKENCNYAALVWMRFSVNNCLPPPPTRCLCWINTSWCTSTGQDPSLSRLWLYHIRSIDRSSGSSVLVLVGITEHSMIIRSSRSSLTSQHIHCFTVSPSSWALWFPCFANLNFQSTSDEDTLIAPTPPKKMEIWTPTFLRFLKKIKVQQKSSG